MANFPYWKLLFSTIVHSFLTGFPYGYHVTVLNQPEFLMKQFVNDSYSLHYPDTDISQNALETLWSVVVASLQIGGVIGCWSTQYLAERLGRKWSLFMVNNIFAVIGSIVLATAKTASSYEMLIVGRLLIGINAGLGSGLLAMYLSECCPVEFRGLMGSFQNLFLTFCAFAANLLARPDVLGNDQFWPIMISLPLIPALLQIGLFPLFPESPKYLLLTKRQELEAAKALIFYNGPTVNTSQIFKGYQQEDMVINSKITMKEVITTKQLRLPILMSIIVSLASMFTGIMIISGYSTSLFESTGLSPELSRTCALIVSVGNLLGAFVALWVNHVFNRRPLLLGCLIICVVSDIVFLISSQVSYHYDYQSWLPYVGVSAFVLHETVFNIGPGSISWFIITEVTPHRARGIGASICITSYWLVNLILLFLFPILLDTWGTWVMLVVVVPCIICIAYLFWRMPETRNKSVDEILLHFQ